LFTSQNDDATLNSEIIFVAAPIPEITPIIAQAPAAEGQDGGVNVNPPDAVDNNIPVVDEVLADSPIGDEGDASTAVAATAGTNTSTMPEVTPGPSESITDDAEGKVEDIKERHPRWQVAFHFLLVIINIYSSNLPFNCKLFIHHISLCILARTPSNCSKPSARLPRKTFPNGNWPATTRIHKNSAQSFSA
jgi:hypothetical protein